MGNLTRLWQIIDRLLSLLPFNGDKLKIGALLALASQIHAMFPGFDVLMWLDARLLAIGVPAIIVGMIHKWAKKALQENAPELLSKSSTRAVAQPDLAKQGLPLSVSPALKQGDVRSA